MKTTKYARLIASAPDLLAALENLLDSRCFRSDLLPEHHDRTERQPPGEAAALQPNLPKTKDAETGKRGGCSLQRLVSAHCGTVWR